MRQRCFPKSRRPIQQNMVKGFIAPLGGFDCYVQVIFYLLLAYEICYFLGPQAQVQISVLVIGLT